MRRRRHRASLVVAPCAAAAVVLLVGHPGGGNGSRSPARAHPAPTRASAVCAAVAALYELSVPAVTSRSRFQHAVRRLAAPGSQPQVQATFGATDPALTAAFRHRPRVLRGAPLGYRVQRFTPTSASVAIWSVAIAASRGFPATAQWRTLVVDLAWTPRGWRVTGGDGIGGPDPSTPLRDLAEQASSFRSFVHVP